MLVGGNEHDEPDGQSKISATRTAGGAIYRLPAATRATADPLVAPAPGPLGADSDRRASNHRRLPQHSSIFRHLDAADRPAAAGGGPSPISARTRQDSGVDRAPSASLAARTAVAIEGGRAGPAAASPSSCVASHPGYRFLRPQRSVNRFMLNASHSKHLRPGAEVAAPERSTLARRFSRRSRSRSLYPP